jgi:hypothetical protein
MYDTREIELVCLAKMLMSFPKFRSLIENVSTCKILISKVCRLDKGSYAPKSWQLPSIYYISK